MTPNNTKWTDDQAEALRGFLASGMSCSQVAFAINRDHGTKYTRNAVIGRASRMGLLIKKSRKPALAKKPAGPRGNGLVRPPPMVPVSPAALLCVEVESRRVSLMELAPDDCRWPAGEGAGVTFCGRPVLRRSYCAAHFMLSIGPGTAVERSADRRAA